MTKELKVLSIGNSFSQDAQRYLHQIAKADGTSVKAVNLYIGGCPLHTHFVNINNDAKAYGLEFNGQSTGFSVSIKEALQSDMWDFITLQQVSHLSVDYSTYQPYLNALVEYIDFHSPKAEILLHQTWAYEAGSEKLCIRMGYDTPDAMMDDIRKSYFEAAEDIGGARIIPSGETMLALSLASDEKIHRDTFHANLGYGRYALGLTWYGMLTGNSILNNSFADFDINTEPHYAELARRVADETVAKYID